MLGILSGASSALDISAWDRITKEDISHSIALKVDEGIIFDDFYLTNMSGKYLANVAVEVVAANVDGDNAAVTADWSGWRIRETKKISESTVYDIRFVRVRIKTDREYADMEYRK
jgi:hypothetical protein